MKLSDKKIGDILKHNGTIIGLFVIIILASFINTNFLTADNISNVLRQASFNGIIALGMTMVIICGSIDLSVGSLYGLAGYIALALSNYSTIAAVLVPLLLGLVVGLLNALLINKVEMAPFIATLTTMMALRGVMLLLTNEGSYVPKTVDPIFAFLGQGVILQYITMPALIFAGLAILTAFFLKKTATGRNMYAAGGNAEAAKMMGVSVNKSIIISHSLISILTAFSGILLVARLGAANPLAGDGAELKAIAAVVIGGTYLTGGRGNILGTVIGVIFMGLLTNVFNMQNTLNPFWEPVITGLLVLGVVLIQSLDTRASNRNKVLT
jgi:Ribose/xylose/arabinose/galactoside ABC-type transport systems, permease components